MFRRPIIRLLLAVITVAALAGCGDDGESTSSDTTGDATATTSAAASPGTSVAEPATVPVFFARDEKVAAAGAEVDDATPEEAVTALLGGPDEFAASIGMSSAIPEGTELLGLVVDDGTATVDLTSVFESGGGSLSMQMRVAQVVYTLTSFDAVERVTIDLDGEPVEAIGGEGVPARDLTADDVRNVTPAVLVMSPLPGVEVNSPLTISGISNTFEANVRYAVTDGDGLIVDEGFTTATAGNGTWGTFEVTSNFEPERSGVGAVIAFQNDAETGGQSDVYEVPVQIP